LYKKKVCKINENKTATTKDNGDASSSGSGEKIIKDRRKSYAGKKITVHDNRRICSHAAECVNNLASVFKLNSRLWIDSDGVTVEEIVNTIRKCPSAALSYSVNGIGYKDQNERKPMVRVSKDGPFIIT
jgi:uncharacterized Fe-S cluster protein YjdI